eukprot:1708296-Rhodomonas_salina.2
MGCISTRHAVAQYWVWRSIIHSDRTGHGYRNCTLHQYRRWQYWADLERRRRYCIDREGARFVGLS